MPSRWDKDPGEILDYKFDFADWLADSETISTRTVTADDGITKDSDSADTASVTVWLSGGTAGTTYRIVCHIATNAGREAERSIYVNARER